MLGRTNAGYEPDVVSVGNGLPWMVSAGAEVLSLSFKLNAGYASYLPWGCSGAPSEITCALLNKTLAQDVAIVAAAGNTDPGIANDVPTAIDFPASYPGVIAVGGAQYNANGVSFWTGLPDPGAAGAFGSKYAAPNTIADYLVGPARSILSTMYTGDDWIVDPGYPSMNCGDNFPSGYYPGYGICSGTSMATPHIAGVMALIRSANPTASLLEAKRILKSTAVPCVLAGTSTIDTTGRCGSGFPDASAAVTQALGGPNVVNRLTPLFAFSNMTEYDHFYTVVPQMANAAVWGTLFPRLGGVQPYYAPVGPAIPNYNWFPGESTQSWWQRPTPRALVSVFTTFKNPIAGVATELAPLYRYSWSSCDANWSCSSHVSHVYSTDKSEESYWIGHGYHLDGIEGYIYPQSQVPPAGAVRLCRKYNSQSDDYILFPGAGANGTDCSATWDGNYPTSPGSFSSAALSGGDDWIGWVYPVSAPHAVCTGGVACPAVVHRIGDFDGDGTADIPWQQSSGGTYDLHLTKGTSTVWNPIYSGIGKQIVSKVGDFDGDGRADILSRDSNGATYMTLMAGASRQAEQLLYSDPAWTVVGTGDFDGDGKTDILWGNASTGQVTMWLMNGGLQNGWTLLSSASNWIVVGTGDFDGDGKSDILWREINTGEVQVWLMNGLQAKSGAVLFKDLAWTIAGTGDFNGDGKTDILWEHASDGQFTMWLMNGLTYSDWGVIATNQPWKIVGTGDFDGDGKADILWRNPSGGAVQMWLMNGKNVKSAQNIYGGGSWTPVGLK